MERKRVVLVPQYMHQFSCIGSECEDSCCSGWRVEIDEATYKKYNRISDRELSALVDKNVTRNRSNSNTFRYAKIVLDEKQRCPFLDEQSLCQIQLKMGEDYLSHTCATYPRTVNKVYGKWEKAATVSCPEVARLALLNPDGIEFDEIEEPMDPRNVVQHEIALSTKSDSIQTYFWELRIFTIQTLQNRTYSLADRLVILGFFFQKAQQYVNEKRVNEIPALIAKYTNYIEEGIFGEQLKDIPVNYAVQMQLLKELTDIRFGHQITSTRYIECFSEALFAMGYTAEATVEEITEKYKVCYDQYYYPFFKDKEYILENYLVNHAYKKLFPFTVKGSLFDNYVMLVLNYALIKLQLIGMAGFYKENFNLEHVIKLTQSFAKVVEHNSQYLNTVKDVLSELEFTTLAYMSILIKN